MSSGSLLNSLFGTRKVIFVAAWEPLAPSSTQPSPCPFPGSDRSSQGEQLQGSSPRPRPGKSPARRSGLPPRVRAGGKVARQVCAAQPNTLPPSSHHTGLGPQHAGHSGETSAARLSGLSSEEVATMSPRRQQPGSPRHLLPPAPALTW